MNGMVRFSLSLLVASLITAAGCSGAVTPPRGGGTGALDESDVIDSGDALEDSLGADPSDGAVGADPSDGAVGADPSDGAVGADPSDTEATDASGGEASDGAVAPAPGDVSPADDGVEGAEDTSGPAEDVFVPECWSGIKLCEDGGIKTCVDGVWSEVDPCVEGTCEDGACVGCTPNCGNKSCGTDGCGGSCGACPAGESCDDGHCPSCVPDCDDRECGADGCGGNCGFCDADLGCAEGLCNCSPACEGKACGPDGCGGECGLCQGDFACSEFGECLPSAYRAVLIQGHWNSSIDCSSYNSTGADIDAVELHGADGELISYFVEVIEEIGTEGCQNNYTDPDQVIGGPDDDYVALQGGWIMGRFADYVPITSGMSVVIHESYSKEAYSIYLATGFDCAESDDPGACSTLVADDGFGSDEFDIP